MADFEIYEIIIRIVIVILAARLGGEVAERVFKQPTVLGELIVGIIISPFALGPLIGFNPIEGAINPAGHDLELLAELGMIVLLFLSGLETDISQLMRFGKIALMVGFGGVVLPFLLGFIVMSVGFYDVGADFNLFYAALFMGAIMTATSVGITARVLKDLKRIRSEEGITILGAAVIDDVLGIVVLAIVIGISGGAVAGQGVDMMGVTGIIAIAVAFWAVILLVALKLNKQVSRLFGVLKTDGGQLVLALIFAFTIAIIAELIGLAMVIGAYAAGLLLSNTRYNKAILEQITPVYHFLVPVFFVTMGMTMNLQLLTSIGLVLLVIVVLVLACIGKLAGCGIVAKMGGFNKVGALRVGIGMMPRGEVGLIVAYIGLSSGIIGHDIFTVGVLMSVFTTVLTPPLLKRVFDKEPEKGWVGSRRKKKKTKKAAAQ